MNRETHYIKNNDTETVYNIDQVREEHFLSNLPCFLDQKVAKEYGYIPYYYMIAEKPLSELQDNEIYVEGPPTFDNGAYYQNWVVKQVTLEEKKCIIAQRVAFNNFLKEKYLSECDWMLLEDSPLTEEEKRILKIYRDKIRRAVIEFAEDPFQLVFPERPYLR